MSEVNAENLLAKGYVKHLDSRGKGRCIYQKTFRDAYDYKEYFVNFTEYNDIFNPFVFKYEADMQITTADEQTINVTFLNPTHIEIVERWAESLWIYTGAVYYE